MILICYKNNFTFFCRWTRGHMISCTAVGSIHHGTVSQKEGNYCSSGMRVVFKPLYVVPAKESRGFSVVMVTGVNRYFGCIDRHTPVMVVGSGSEGAHGEEGEGKGRKGPSDHGITAPLQNLTQEIRSRHKLKYSTCTAAGNSSTGWKSTAAEDRCGTTVPWGILYTNSPGFLRLRRMWSLWMLMVIPTRKRRKPAAQADTVNRKWRLLLQLCPRWMPV